MTRKQSDIERVGIVGCGVLGRGWVLHFLRMGFEVIVYDPSDGVEDAVSSFIAESWPVAERLGLKHGGSPANLRFAGSLAELGAEADFIQESGPEALDAKVALYQELDAATPEDVIIASSTSGLPMSDIASRCANPQRCVVGHPFHPVHLIPLLEVVGGQHTDEAVLDWTVEFYGQIEMEPVRLSNELPGFVGNRLQEAMFREAVHMLVNGEATAAEIDLAITYGPGPRWAWMGPLLTYHLASGEGGIAATMHHFKGPMADYVHGASLPDLSEDELRQLGEELNRLTGTSDVAELEKKRDDFLLGLVELRRELAPSMPRALRSVETEAL